MASHGAHAKKPSENEPPERLRSDNSESSYNEKSAPSRTLKHARGKHVKTSDPTSGDQNATLEKRGLARQAKATSPTSRGRHAKPFLRANEESPSANLSTQATNHEGNPDTPAESKTDPQLHRSSLRCIHSPHDARSSNAKKAKTGCGKKAAIGVLCVLAIALIGCCIAFGFFVSSVNGKLATGKTDEEMAAAQNALAEHANFTEPFYMLLLGSDSRTSDTAGSRSDTCIVVRVDPADNTITMISIPRDTMIAYNGNKVKFNAAYAYDGIAGTVTAVNELLGIEISHFAEVSFGSFVDLIDAMGGIEVEVPRRISDWRAGNVTVEEGFQTLDGEAALVMARSRQYVDGDFTRSSNQRLIVEALINKVLTLPASEIPSVIQDASACISTDFSVTDIVSLALQFAGIGDNLTIYSIMVPSTTETINGASYVIADDTGLAKMMEVVNAGGDPNKVKTYGATGSSLNANGKPSIAKVPLTRS